MMRCGLFLTNFNLLFHFCQQWQQYYLPRYFRLLMFYIFYSIQKFVHLCPNIKSWQDSRFTVTLYVERPKLRDLYFAMIGFGVIPFNCSMLLTDAIFMQVIEKEAESGGKLGELDSYEIEGGETKSEILQNLAEFQFSCVSSFQNFPTKLTLQLAVFPHVLVYCTNGIQPKHLACYLSDMI